MKKLLGRMKKLLGRMKKLLGRMKNVLNPGLLNPPARHSRFRMIITHPSITPSGQGFQQVSRPPPSAHCNTPPCCRWPPCSPYSRPGKLPFLPVSRPALGLPGGSGGSSPV
jgi:hypothetical protein